MKDRKIRFFAAAMAAVCLTVGAAVAAGEGTQADPLITLSYLNQTAVPAMLEQVDGKAQAYQAELAGKLDQAIQQYTAKMEELVGDESVQQHSAAYTVITLQKGQQLNMDIGCEVLLRIGTARCVSQSNPGLINTTTGSILNNGKDLEVNHLYMATITGRSIKATADVTKVLVRGGYTIV